MNPSLSTIFPRKSGIVIGMVHLLPLPGAPLYRGSLETVLSTATRDAQTLVKGGVDGIMIENFGDIPFYPGRVPAETVAALTAAAVDVRRIAGKTPIGINVLRNDGLTAIAIAAATAARFVRINVIAGARVCDQGVIEGQAHDVLRLRKALAADGIAIMADVDVKHSAALAARPIEDEVDDTVERAMASALVVSGAGTGKATDLEKVKKVKAAAGNCPVFIGSGVTAITAPEFLAVADGVIVGTSLKEGGKVENPVDLARVRAVVKAAHR